MINLSYELWPIWTDWLEEQEQETALLKFYLENFIFLFPCDTNIPDFTRISCYDKDTKGNSLHPYIDYFEFTSIVYWSNVDLYGINRILDIWDLDIGNGIYYDGDS